jgi:hypothetical protein
MNCRAPKNKKVCNPNEDEFGLMENRIPGWIVPAYLFQKHDPGITA